MITGVIFGSGFSRRMGTDKLLLEIDGDKIIEKVIKACKESNLDKIILIYRNKEVMEIGRKYNIKTVYNERAEYGQSESMKLGVKEAEDSDSYMFLLGDQPFIYPELINQLIKEYRNSGLPILVPYYNNVRGVPVIISSIFKGEILKIEGDKGARDLIKDNASKVKKLYIDDEKPGIDIDTQDDYEKFRY